jgi:hypothetical protein
MPRASAEVKQILKAGRALPQPVAGDLIDVEARGSRYGDLYINNLVQTKHVMADEGSYFVATPAGAATPVAPGTGVQASNTFAYSATTCLFIVKNDHQPGPNGKRIYFDFLRLIPTAIPTGTLVSFEFVIKTDSSARFASGGVLVTPANVNMDDTMTQSQARVWAFTGGASVTASAEIGTQRLVSRAHLSTSQGIAGDEYVLQFGANDLNGFQGLTAARAVATARIIGNAAPVIIGPQQTALFHWWWLTSSSQPSFEYELAWWER